MTTKFIGLDVHKDTIAIAVADGDGAREVRFHGTMANTPGAIRRLVARLSAPGAPSSCWSAGAIRPATQVRRTGAHATRATPVTSAQVWKAWVRAARYWAARR
jgi:hypothetical protein